MPKRLRGLVLVLAAFQAAGALAQDGDIEEGREIFTSGAQPACKICHTLEDAGATGRIGPDLDDLQPTEEQVRNVVRGGADGMPPYDGRLSEEEIDAVAEYVAEMTGG